MKARLSLTYFDNRLMNGLDFCKKVYEFTEQIRKGPDGVNRLRVRDREEKKLMEELVPIARYVQARYSLGRLMKVRWILGNQPYDACVLSAGFLTEKSVVPKRQFLEVTTAVHRRDYMLRQLLTQEQLVFSVKGISQDRRSKNIVSRPYVSDHREAENALARRILDCISAKAAKRYPRGTALVIQGIPDELMLADEWEYTIQKVKESDFDHEFDEVFIFTQRHEATIYKKSEPDRSLTP